MLLRIVGDIQITALISSNDRTLCERLMLKKSRPIMLAGITDWFYRFPFSTSSTYCVSKFTVPSIPSLEELMERS